MKFVRSFLVFLAAVSLGFWLYLAVTAYSVTKTVADPAYVKSLLTTSGVYNNFVDSALKLATAQSGPNNAESKAQIEQLTPVVKQAVTPAVLQSITEQFINGTANWLNGKSTQPDFVINLAPIRASLIQAGTDSAYNKVVSLPICPRGVIPVSDPFNATCRPAGQITKADFQPGIEQFVGQLPFLDKDTLTNQTITTAKEAQAPAKPLPAQIPVAYKWSKTSPYIIGLLALLSVAVIVLLKRDHVRAWKTVGHTFLITGIVLVFTSIVAKIALGRPISALNGGDEAQKLFVIDIIQPLAKNLGLKLSDYTLYFGVLYILIAAVCYIVGLQLMRRNHAEKLADEASGANMPLESPPKSELDYTPGSTKEAAVDSQKYNSSG